MQNFFCSEGNLGRNIKLSHVALYADEEPRPVIEFDVRFPKKKRNADGSFEDRFGFWARVSLWGKTAEHLHRHLRSGCRVLVVGEFGQEPYTRTRGEQAGQEAIANFVTAHYVGLSCLGIESVSYRGRGDQSREARIPSADDDEPAYGDDDAFYARGHTALASADQP